MNPLKQKRLLDKFLSAKSYMFIISVLSIYYMLRGYYDVTFMLLFLLFIFYFIKKKIKKQLLGDDY